MIYTTNFSNFKYLPNNILPISIDGKGPDDFKGLRYNKLQPKYEFFLKCEKDNAFDYFTKCYKEQILDKLSIYEVLSDLIDIIIETGEQKEICLVTWEPTNYSSHRHLVSEWLRNNGVKCEEWSKK